MIVFLYLMLMIIGGFLIAKSINPEIPIGEYIGMFIGIGMGLLFMIWLYFYWTGGRRAWTTGLGAGLAQANPADTLVIRALVGTAEQVMNNPQIIELNADDLDPRIQQALVESLFGRPPLISREEVLAKWSIVDSTQSGNCGICFEKVHGTKTLRCPQCEKDAHKECLEKWIKSGQNICIYCRHNPTTCTD